MVQFGHNYYLLNTSAISSEHRLATLNRNGSKSLLLGLLALIHFRCNGRSDKSQQKTMSWKYFLRNGTTDINTGHVYRSLKDQVLVQQCTRAGHHKQQQDHGRCWQLGLLGKESYERWKFSPGDQARNSGWVSDLRQGGKPHAKSQGFYKNKKDLQQVHPAGDDLW